MFCGSSGWVDRVLDSRYLERSGVQCPVPVICEVLGKPCILDQQLQAALVSVRGGNLTVKSEKNTRTCNMGIWTLKQIPLNNTIYFKIGKKQRQGLQ